MGNKQNLEIEILFENDDFLVINKQSGIVVNRSDTTKGETTLQDLIDEYVQKTQKTPIVGKSEIQLSRMSDKFDNLTDRKSDSPSIPSFPNDSDVEFRKRSGIVHRLDKETSGLLIVAKNPKAFENLQAQFKERKVDKSYLALAHGQIVPEKGEIKVPVGRLPWNRKRFGVVAGGREAATKYQTISNFKYPALPAGRPISNETTTLVRLYPKTGRTHQIRVHLKYVGHPIFADPLYGGRKISRQDRALLPRIFLHSETLSFQDPKTGERVRFESQLPEQLKKFIDSLEKVEY